MKRFNLALLSDETLPEDVSPLEDSDVLDLRREEADASAKAGAIDDAQAAVDALDETAATLEQSDAQADPTAVALASIVIESWCAQVGVKRPQRLGLESLQAKKPDAKALALEVRQLQKQLNERIAVAQEGFFQEMGFRFSSMFTSEKKLRVRRAEASQKYEDKGQSKEMLKDRPYAKFFNPKNVQELTSKDAVRTMELLASNIDNANLKEVVRELTGLASDIVRATSGWYADAKDKAMIDRVAEELNEVNNKFYEELVHHQTGEDNGTIAPLDPSDKKKIMALVDKAYDSGDFEQRVHALAHMVATYEQNGSMDIPVGDYNFTYTKSYAANAVMAKISQALHRLYGIMHARFDVTYAFVRYMEESTQK